MDFKSADEKSTKTKDIVRDAGFVPGGGEPLGFSDVMYSDPLARYLIAASAGGVGYHLIKNLVTPRKYKEYISSKPFSSRLLEFLKDIATGALISTPVAFAYPYLYGMFRGTSNLPPPDASRGDFSKYLKGTPTQSNEINEGVSETLKRVGTNYEFLKSPDDERFWPSGIASRVAYGYLPSYALLNWRPVRRVLYASSALRDLDDYRAIIEKYKDLYGEDSPIVRAVAKQLAENTGDANALRRLLFYFFGPKPYEVDRKTVNELAPKVYDYLREQAAINLASAKTAPGFSPSSVEDISRNIGNIIKNLPDAELAKLREVAGIENTPLGKFLKEIQEAGINDQRKIADILRKRGLPPELAEAIRKDIGRKLAGIPSFSGSFANLKPVKEAMDLENIVFNFASKWPAPGRNSLGKNIYSTADFIAAVATISGMTPEQLKALPNNERLALLRALLRGPGLTSEGKSALVESIIKMKGAPTKGIMLGPLDELRTSIEVRNLHVDTMKKYVNSVLGQANEAIPDDIMLRFKKLFDDPNIKVFLGDKNAIRQFLEDSEIFGASKGSITRSSVLGNIADELSKIVGDVSNQNITNKMEPMVRMRDKLSRLGDSALNYVNSVQQAGLDQESRLFRIYPIFTQGSASSAVNDPQIGHLFSFARDAGVNLDSYKFQFADEISKIKAAVPRGIGFGHLSDVAMDYASKSIVDAMQPASRGFVISPKNGPAYALVYSINEIIHPNSDAFDKILNNISNKVRAAGVRSPADDLLDNLMKIRSQLGFANDKMFSVVNGELVLDLPGAIGQQIIPDTAADSLMKIFSDSRQLKILDSAIEEVFRNTNINVANREVLGAYMAAKDAVMPNFITRAVADAKHKIASLSDDDLTRVVTAMIVGDDATVSKILGPVDKELLKGHVSDILDIPRPKSMQAVTKPSIVKSVQADDIVRALENASESTLVRAINHIDKISGGAITKSLVDVKNMSDSDIARAVIGAINKTLSESGGKLADTERDTLIIIRDILASRASPSTAVPRSSRAAKDIISALRSGRPLRRNVRVPIVGSPITKEVDAYIDAGKGSKVLSWLRRSPAWIAGIDTILSLADLAMNLNDPALHKYKLTSSTMSEIREKGFAPTDPKVVMSIILDSAEKSLANKSQHYPLLPPAMKDGKYDANSVNRFIDDLIKYVAANDTTTIGNIAYSIGGVDATKEISVLKKAYNIMKQIEDGVPLMYSTGEGATKKVTVRPDWALTVINEMTNRYPGLIEEENDSSLANIFGLK